MKNLQSIQQMVVSRKSKIDELETQRECNASDGNWTIVKACKETVYKLRQEVSLLNSILEEDAV